MENDSKISGKSDLTPMMNCGLFIYRPQWSAAGQRGVWSLNHHYHNVRIFHLCYLRDPEAD